MSKNLIVSGLTALICLTINVVPAMSQSSGDAKGVEVWKIQQNGASGTWNIKRPSDNSVSGRGGLDGESPYVLLGRIEGKELHVMSPACLFDGTISNNIVTGYARCRGTRVPWTATMPNEGPAKEVRLLKPGQHVEDTAEFRAASQKEKEDIETEKMQYVSQIQAALIFKQLRDQACLEDQFVFVRLQRPNWGYSVVRDKIDKTCINIEGVASMAKNKCESIFQNSNSDLCSCYSKNFTETYLKNPIDDVDAFTQMGLHAIAVCKH